MCKKAAKWERQMWANTSVTLKDFANVLNVNTSAALVGYFRSQWSRELKYVSKGRFRVVFSSTFLNIYLHSLPVMVKNDAFLKK